MFIKKEKKTFPNSLFDFTHDNKIMKCTFGVFQAI